MSLYTYTKILKSEPAVYHDGIITDAMKLKIRAVAHGKKSKPKSNLEGLGDTIAARGRGEDDEDDVL